MSNTVQWISTQIYGRGQFTTDPMINTSSHRRMKDSTILTILRHQCLLWYTNTQQKIDSIYSEVFDIRIS